MDLASLFSEINKISKIRNKMRSRSFESFCTLLSPGLALTSSVGETFELRTNEKNNLCIFDEKLSHMLRIFKRRSPSFALAVLVSINSRPFVLHREWEKTRARKDIWDKAANFCNSPDMSLATFPGCDALPKNAENKSDARLYRDYRLHRGEK